MPFFKCKSCGGEIRVDEGQSVAVCEYCQREQSLSKSKSEVIVNLFNRANSLRLKNEFDKSQEIYEKILVEEPDDAEAHWGIVLCKYGIEYVKESEWTYSEIPTCHRTQYESILADADYLAAIENADIAQKACYESEAKKIAELQKNVLEVVRNEKPFDVFICYKEKDEYGNRTVDSGIANDIYYQLTQEGFKVFYAAITLEDKLGTAYEPYIFAALNSAKVMLVLGTKPEYFNAVWVKNEWARYLKIIKNDRNRLLIPCYKDMDAYELPEEFAHLQAQDMSKVGFITDIIRGIKKIIPKENKTNSFAGYLNISATGTAAPILKRVFLCLEDGDFQKAESLLEQVLNLDPECAEAYIAKMMIERKLKTREALYSFDFDLKDDPMYVRALNFADESYKTVLEGYRNESIYRKANSYLEQNTIEKYNAAKPLYEKIIEYKDAKAKRESCDVGITEIHYQAACRLKREADNFKDTARVTEAIEAFRKLGAYKDSSAQVDECIELKKLIQYKNAVDTKQRASHSNDADFVSKYYDNAIALFAGLNDYKDSVNQKIECERLKVDALYNIALSNKDLADKNNDASMYHKAALIFSQIANYKDSAELEEKCEREAQNANTDAAYRKATELSKKDDIQSLNTAINIFTEISEWKDSAALSKECKAKIDSINVAIERKNKTEALQAEWKQLIFSERNLLSLKAENASIEKTKVIRRIFLLTYLVCVSIAVIFAANKIEFLQENTSITNFINVVVFENIPLLICVIVAIIASLLTTSNAFLWYVNAFGIIIFPIGIIINVIRFFSPIGENDKKRSKQWKDFKSEFLLTQRRKKEIETELKNLLGADVFNNYKTALFSSITNIQDSVTKRRGQVVAKIAYLIIVAIAAFGIFLFYYIVPNIRYENAVELMTNENYEAAYTVFEDLNDFKDSPEKLYEVDSILTKRQIQAIQTSSVGDSVTFGGYEQDVNITNGKEKIEWIVLEKDEEKVLLISKYCLDQEPDIDSLQWETSNVRKWLNNDFFNTAFTECQQEKVFLSEIQNMQDGNVRTMANNTVDHVYLLSVDEVKKYFPTASDRIAECTQYLIQTYEAETAGWWALRTPTNSDRCVACIDDYGQIHDNDMVVFSGKTVRPVICVDISEKP